ncbi:Vanillyl-alcohol oxidase [Colletotrichum higginsianum IMI 349063]|uniref:Vanillyl-alcohol oxidase n=3 Tax=Colletotrichum higginsianum TaxID=80884 RepID=A0A1B7Y7L9_COLHI|nr:Vanillyl-alcohol oxidase [Colletotrichum higginsianum IMI 349063]OBR08026.1 Vanillyl-alcohol oxidase [Colletotrichum higginsianum IMI 349063]
MSAPTVVTSDGPPAGPPTKSLPSLLPPRMLPPGVEQDSFQAFAQRVVSVVGASNLEIIAGDTPLENDDFGETCFKYDRYRSADNEALLLGCAVVHPRHVADVKAVLALCTSFNVPLWPVSAGRNLAYGGAAPRVPGSLVMRLGTHMNRILDVDTAHFTCVVEPGVTYQQLHNHLKEKGLLDKVRLDTPEVPWGSMIGNALDRGGGATPYGDHWGTHSGMEVVMPDGDVVRTGMGAMSSPEGRREAAQGVPPEDQTPNSCWTLFPYGFGPINDGLFSQGSVGIVTKMGFWLMPNFPGITPFMVTYARDEDIQAAVEIVGKLRLHHVLAHSCSIRYITLDTGFYSPRAAFTDSPKDVILTEEELDAMCARNTLGRWNFTGCVYGPPKIRELTMQVIREEMTKPAGSRLYTLDDRTERPSMLHGRAPNMEGLCNMDQQNWIKQWMPNAAHILFTPVSRIDGGSALEQFQLAKALFAEYQMDFFGHLAVYHRDMHNVSCIVYDSEDAAMRGRAWDLARRLIDEWQKRGWGEMRTHIGLHDQVAASYDFNNRAMLRLNEKVKEMLDPKGIIAPGKSGIWPRGYDRGKYLMGKDHIDAFPGVEGALLRGGPKADARGSGGRSSHLQEPTCV